MSVTGKSSWKTDWTAEEPPPIAFVHVPAGEGAWVASERVELAQRDLGLSSATDGVMGVRHLKAERADVAGTWRAHDLDFQCLYVLKGTVKIETADGQHASLEIGGAAYQPGLLRYRTYEMSEDFEAVEITIPATYETVEGREVPLPARAVELYPARAGVYTTDAEENYAMAAGPRPFFRYRDLGTRGPTEDRIHIHVVRATGQPGEGTGWHYHTMAQWFMILGGSSDIRVEGGPRIGLGIGDTMCIGAGPTMRHNVAPFSGDYAVLEMCVPAEYDTIAVDAPDGAAD